MIDKDFAERFGIQILDYNKRVELTKKYQTFTNPKDKDIFRSDERTEQEPLVTLSIPLSKLRLLQEIEAHFFNFDANQAARVTFETLLDQIQEERYYQHTVEGVKNAYEQYSLMLHLAKNGNN